MLVSEVINRVRVLLQDTRNPPRWTDSYIVDTYNEARRQIEIFRPDAFAQITDHICNGEFRQPLWGNAQRLLDVWENIGINPETGSPVFSGTVIKTDRKTLDAFVPDWTNATTEDRVEMYVYDERSPKEFYLYPTPPGDHILRVLVRINPDIIREEFIGSTDVDVSQEYLNTLIFGMAGICCLMDSRDQTNAARAQMFLRQFASDLGIKDTKDIQFSVPVQGDTDGKN